LCFFFFFSSRRRHTRCLSDWSSDVCSSDLVTYGAFQPDANGHEYQNLATVERDFAQMAAAGINAVRIPHTVAPRTLLDAAARHEIGRASCRERAEIPVVA